MSNIPLWILDYPLRRKSKKGEKGRAMYILASDFFERDINSYLKLEIRVLCEEFLAFIFLFIFFSKQIR